MLLLRPIGYPLLALAAVCAACGGHSSSTPAPTPVPNPSLTPVPASAEWPSALPDAEGLDPARLTSLVGRIRQGSYGTITSLLIVRNGQLVVEEYFNTVRSTMALKMYSVSKSVTSLATGIAIDQGRIATSDAIIARFHSYDPIANLDSRKQALTVRDLLTMQTGFDWDETSYTGSPLERMNNCRCDWLRFMLDWPMRDAPGTRWQYVTGGVTLLGGFLGEATGQRLDLFAQQNLFSPLEAQSPYWNTGLPDGLPDAGAGLNMRPRDMAKIGQMVLDDGRWRGRQIVSASWMQQSTAPKVFGVGSFGSHGADYGDLWWILNPGDIVMALGARGQFIFASRQDHLVVTVTSDNQGSNWTSPVDFLYTDIIPAIR